MTVVGCPTSLLPQGSSSLHRGCVFALRPGRSGFVCYSNKMISLNMMATDEPGVKSVSSVLWKELII